MRVDTLDCLHMRPLIGLISTTVIRGGGDGTSAVARWFRMWLASTKMIHLGDLTRIARGGGGFLARIYAPARVREVTPREGTIYR